MLLVCGSLAVVASLRAHYLSRDNMLCRGAPPLLQHFSEHDVKTTWAGTCLPPPPVVSVAVAVARWLIYYPFCYTPNSYTVVWYVIRVMSGGIVGGLGDVAVTAHRVPLPRAAFADRWRCQLLRRRGTSCLIASPLLTVVAVVFWWWAILLLWQPTIPLAACRDQHAATITMPTVVKAAA